MSFKDYAEKSKEYMTKFGLYLTGKNSAPSLTIDIDLSTELNALHNASSSEQLIQLSNGFYDQVAFKRSLIEVYKKPKDYLKEQQLTLDSNIKSLDSLSKDISLNIDSVKANQVRSQSARSISDRLQLKLSLIKDNTNA